MIQRRAKRIPSLVKKADRALKMAVRKLIEERKRKGQPLIIWRDGRVFKIPADQLKP